MHEFAFKKFMESEVDDVLDKGNLILFFKKGPDLFGAPEESRVMFAKLKAKQADEDENSLWKKEAKFIALNLIKALLGQETENLFGPDDLPQIEILDRDQAKEILAKHKK